MVDKSYHGFHSESYCLMCARSTEGSDVPYCDSICESRFVEVVGLKHGAGEHLTGVERFVLKHGTRTNIAVA